VRILIFPNWAACFSELSTSADSDVSAVIAGQAMKALLRPTMIALPAQGTGASNRIVGAMVMDVPPSGPAGELTEKGTINARALLRGRAEQVDRLFWRSTADGVFVMSALDVES
jgi:feruloyl-CoA synthase